MTMPNPDPGALPKLAQPTGPVLVVGLGTSGLAAARLLAAGGAAVRVYDRSATTATLPPGVEGFLGHAHVPAAALDGVDTVVLSPGVPPGPIREAITRHAPKATVEGELGLARRLAASHWSAIPTVLVTGTNGKSTVTAMTAGLLRAGGRAAFAGGNLGPPLSQHLLDVASGQAPRPDALVLECSSYQLETMPPLPTAVAMVLNVTPDHLDRYRDLRDYAATKARIFAGLGPADLALFPSDDPFAELFAAATDRNRTIRIGPSDGAHLDGSDLVLPNGERYPRELLRVPGRHNGKNALFALAAARHLGVSTADCTRGLQRFEGLPHRMAAVRTVDDVIYYDDSKATNVAAVLASLDGFDRPLVLIAGGRPKGDDFAPLRDLLARGGRALVTLGEAAPAIAAAVGDRVPVTAASDMAEAVAIARTIARPGDAVVLSPGCASFDQFENFVARGRAFAAAVEALPDAGPP